MEKIKSFRNSIKHYWQLCQTDQKLNFNWSTNYALHAGTAQVPCFVVGGGDTRLCAHPDYTRQQQERGDEAVSNESVCSHLHETHAAYLTADLAFRQSSSTAAASLLGVHDGSLVEDETTIYVLDREATARLDDVARVKVLDQRPHKTSFRFRRSISKKCTPACTKFLSVLNVMWTSC